MQEKIINQLAAEQRLQQLPALASLLGDNWIAQEYARPMQQRSLVTGWISSQEEIHLYWLEDLNSALAFLKTQVHPNSWQTLSKKVGSHSTRSNFKGTLSEVAMCVFLARNNIAFELEARLVSGSNKNVDVKALAETPIYIEVQWLSPSDISERGADIASDYDEAYEMDFDAEKYRIKHKVSDKTPKFTMEDITLVALDCTTAPELGGTRRFSTIKAAIAEAYTGRNWQGEETPYAQSDIDKAIRQFVNGVIWFELEPRHQLVPAKRDFCLNPALPTDRKAILNFVELWKSTG
jgi:hypothetical protein